MTFFNNHNKYILLFHRVSPERDAMWDPVTPEAFETLIKYATQKFEVVTLNELLFTENISNSKPLATITFDDGYKDFIEYAHPVLKKYNVPSTIFVVTDCIENNVPTWTYLSDYYFFNTEILKIKDTEILSGLPSEFRKTSWASRDERIHYGKRLKQHLKRVPDKTRNKVQQYYISNFNDVEPPSDLMLSWNDLRKIKSEGVEIGSHSVNHPTLATVEKDDDLIKELVLSKEKLVTELGEISSVFSYPCGSFNERVKQICLKSGYKAALAVKGKPWDEKTESDLFEIPRIEFYNEPLWKSKLRISRAYDTVKNWRNKVAL